MKNLIKQKQLDIDRLVPAVLFESSPEPEEQEKPKRIHQRWTCGVCQQDDVYCEGVLEGKRVYLCYNCGNEPTQKAIDEQTEVSLG